MAAVESKTTVQADDESVRLVISLVRITRDQENGDAGSPSKALAKWRAVYAALLAHIAAKDAEIAQLRANFAGLKCRFGCDEVVGLFHVPQGCVCWTDPVQALCGQHAERAQSSGSITLIAGAWPESLASKET